MKLPPLRQMLRGSLVSLSRTTTSPMYQNQWTYSSTAQQMRTYSVP